MDEKVLIDVADSLDRIETIFFCKILNESIECVFYQKSRA